MKKSGQNNPPVIELKEYTDNSSGEVFTVPVFAKPTEYDKDFYKVWIGDMLVVLDKIGGAKMKALNYILKNIEPSSNRFLGTLREITEATGLAKQTVNTTIKLLIECNFFVKERVACYMVNPDLIVKGNTNKHRMLMIKYTAIDGETSNHNEAQAEAISEK